jgi:Rieske Fe-S protein
VPDVERPERREFLGKTVPALLLALTGVTSAADWAGTFAASVNALRDERRYPIPGADGVAVDRDAGVILVRQARRVFALAVACPHEGGGLRWRQADLRFQCPRHESKFRPDGTFIEGKARRNMDRLPIRQDGQELVVDPAAPIRSDRQADAWLAAEVVL